MVDEILDFACYWLQMNFKNYAIGYKLVTNEFKKVLLASDFTRRTNEFQNK